MRLIVAITGASGVVYGKILLEELRSRGIETHLVVSNVAERVIEHELELTRSDLEKLADHAYDINDLTAPMVSGSFKTHGMVVSPCSMKTMSGIVHGYSDNLILRAADVALKERRKLVLVPRETPLNIVHLQNMLELARQGVMIVPAMPAYYHKPKSIDELVDYVVGKVLDCIGIDHALFERWTGSE